MSDKYKIANTTKTQRHKLAADALVICKLDAQPPTDKTMKLVQQYVNGKIEISDVLNKTIDSYKVSAAK